MKFRGGMAELMRQASRMQRKIERRREELKEQEFQAGAGNDQVKVTVLEKGNMMRPWTFGTSGCGKNKSYLSRAGTIIAQ